jgi:hypothetical protein
VKVAFHFDADHASLQGSYGSPIMKAVFSRLLGLRFESFSTKVFIGDLLLVTTSYRPEQNGNMIAMMPDRDRLEKLFREWLQPENPIWSTLKEEKLRTFLNGRVFVLCLESVSYSCMEALDRSLWDLDYYLGSHEVDDATAAHWVLYSHSLIPCLRISGSTGHIFHDGFEDPQDYRDVALEGTLRQAGFSQVKYESLNGKFSLFDVYHDFEHARRISEWKRRSGALLAFVADNVVSRLCDTAPELGNRLWAALDLFERAETDEQYAQVSASCRRAIEYVVDCIFPPVHGEQSGRFKLGQPQYRNRLLAFADQARKSDTNIDLITVSTKALAEQLEKLEALVNKGVHADVYRSEARRCLLRVILLFDDILSLKSDPFDIQGHI